MTDATVTEASLPAPTGPYPVGRTAYYWDGTGSGDLPSAATGERREMVAWVWYPAAPEAGAERAAYLPTGWEASWQILGLQTDGVRSHAYPDAPPAADRARFPVLFFPLAGFAPLTLAAILEEVASHGYVVVGINHTAESAVTVFPDGRVVPMDAARMQPAWGPFSGAAEVTFRGRAAIAESKAADMRFVADQLEALDAGADRLAGRLDLTRLAAFGHSLGGNAALEFCRADTRCRAAANLDGGIWTAAGRIGIERPTLLVLADHRDVNRPCEEQVSMGIYPTVAWCEAERALMVGGWQAAYELGQPGYAVLIEGSGHISFMDAPFLPVAPGSMGAASLASVRLDGRRTWRIVCDHLLAFFARHLDGAAAPLLDGPPPAFPEAKRGAPRDLLGEPVP